jgi:xanthosine utilization system XapX-like protein
MDHNSMMARDQAIPIQRLAAAGLRVLAVMILVGGLLVSAIYWVVEWQTPPLPWPLAAVILLQILFAGAIVSWFWLLWRRAGMLGNLVAHDYPVMTCTALCARLLGELIAILFVLSSLAFSIASLVAADLAAETALAWLDLRADIVEPTTYGLAVVTALLWPIAGLAAGGFVLFGAYLFAEVLVAKLEFWRDIRRIREQLQSGIPSPDGKGPSTHTEGDR